MTNLQQELMKMSKMILDKGVSSHLLSKFERTAIARYEEIKEELKKKEERRKVDGLSALFG